MPEPSGKRQPQLELRTQLSFESNTYPVLQKHPSDGLFKPQFDGPFKFKQVFGHSDLVSYT
jgi:hypothetical protein